MTGPGWFSTMATSSSICLMKRREPITTWSACGRMRRASPSNQRSRESPLIHFRPLGGVAQLGRALAWHARGQGFKSPHLHWHPAVRGLFGLERFDSRRFDQDRRRRSTGPVARIRFNPGGVLKRDDDRETSPWPYSRHASAPCAACSPRKSGNRGK